LSLLVKIIGSLAGLTLIVASLFVYYRESTRHQPLREVSVAEPVSTEDAVPTLPSGTVPARVLAFLLDTAIQLFLIAATASIFGFLLAAAAPTSVTDQALGPAIALVLMLVFVGIPAYFILFQGAIGTTPGKGIMRLRLAGESHPGSSLLQAVVRTVLLPIDLLFAGLVGIPSILATKRKQRLGDLAAKTMVVTTGPLTPTVFVRGLLFLVAFVGCAGVTALVPLATLKGSLSTIMRSLG
jgi:uncharacterized RDD family membrane protein YckC